MMAYWRERFPASLFVPAAALLALAAGGTTRFDAREWGAGTLAALLLLAQFRLWDDLADLGRDRATHPDRVLVTSGNTDPYFALCLGLGVLNLLWSGRHGAPSFAACLALNCVAAAWYTWRPQLRTAAADLAVLLKYPAFVILLASGSPTSRLDLLLSALAVYLAAAAFELWHDATSPLRWNNS